MSDFGFGLVKIEALTSATRRKSAMITRIGVFIGLEGGMDGEKSRKMRKQKKKRKKKRNKKKFKKMFKKKAYMLPSYKGAITVSHIHR